MKCKRIMLIVMLILMQLFSELRSQPVIVKEGDIDSSQATSRDIDVIVQSLRGPLADGAYNLMDIDSLSGSVRLSTTKEGYLIHLGAPAYHDFPISDAVPGDVPATVLGFIGEHRAALGITNREFGFVEKKTSEKHDRSTVRFEQTYAGIPVFAAETLVQLNEAGGLEYLASDIMRDSESHDALSILGAPLLAASEAELLAVEMMARKYPGLEFNAEPADLMIYIPSIVGNVGPTRLVWHTKVASVLAPFATEAFLVDVNSGEIALHYSLICNAMHREVYYEEYFCLWGICIRLSRELAREEGQEEYKEEPKVNDAYKYLGDVYKFYKDVHGRDSIDNAGMTMIASVANIGSAYWSGNTKDAFFGVDYVTDDVVAHEVTHGVTQYESGLIYLNESGAINESISDMWAEWIDQTYHHVDDPNDSNDVKWLIGEDVNQVALGGRRAIRNMKDPAEFGHPNRKSSPYWHNWLANPKPDSYENDWGGVHINSGVGNKLCYLLTDGGSSNKCTIDSMGISKAAELFYEVQTRLLTAAADYYDLYSALRQAVNNLIERKPNEWTHDDLQNVERACRAVEIDSPSEIEDEQREYYGSDFPIELIDNGTTYSNIHIENVGAVIDLNVKLDMSHTRDEDLDVSLIAPNGTRIELFSDVGGTGDDFRDTVIDDDAHLSITEGLPPFTGSYRPEPPFSLLSFYGANIEGIWTLEITDDEFNETGILNSWSLDIVSLTNTVFAFVERFPSRLIDSTKWAVTQGTPTVVYRYTKTVPVYSLKMSGGDNAIDSRQIDLSSYSHATLSYGYQRTGWNRETQRWGESPEVGDDLIIECWDKTAARWMELDYQSGDGPDMYYYGSSSLLLPQEMLTTDFMLRIRTVGDKGDWFIDDVMIKGQRETTTESIEPVAVIGTDGRIMKTAFLSSTNPGLEYLPSHHSDDDLGNLG